MYVLYGNNKGMQELVRNENEEVIKEALSLYIDYLEHINYLVVNKTPKQDFPIKTIMTYKDYEEYTGKQKVLKK